VWVVAQVLELSLPPLTTRIHRRVRTSASHLPERWALFTLIVLGESVVAVAVGTAGTHWRPSSVGAAVLGFIAVAAIWWLYFDRQANVELRGSTMSVVVYSYAHIPLLIGLAAMSAGLRLVIDRTGQGHLGAGAAAALVGGAVLYLLALVGTRTVTVGGPHRVGVSLKAGGAVVMVGFLLAQGLLPPVVMAGVVAGVLVAVVFAERTLIQPSQRVS
jgi:low temperature requirement protein LtrA